MKTRSILVVACCILFNSTSFPDWQPTNTYTAWSIEALCWDGEYLYASTWRSVYVSSNLGIRWEPANTGLGTEPRVDAFLNVQTATGSLVLCAKNGDGVYRTTNHGATWSPSGTGLPSGAPGAFIQFGTKILASFSTDIYRTTDFGITWTDATNDPDVVDVFNMCVSGSTIFASRGWNNIIKSTDEGTTWDIVVLPRTDMYFVTSIAGNGANVYVPTLGFSTPARFFRSTDYGATWSEGSPDFGGLAYDIVVVPSVSGNDTLFIGNDGYASRSTDGGTTWQVIQNGLPGYAELTKLVYVSSAAYRAVYAGMFPVTLFPVKSGVFRTTTDGTAWEGMNAGISDFNTRGLYGNGPVLLAGTQGLDMMRSANAGVDWDLKRTGYGNDDVNVFTRYDGKIYCGTSRGVSVSYDEGASWPSGIFSGNVIAMAFLGTSVFVSTPSTFYRSTNGGATWNYISGQYVVAIHADSAALGASRVLVGTTATGVYLSTDGGATWAPSNSGLPGIVTVSAFTTITSGDTVRVFAGTSQGMYVSVDGGASWTDVNSGLTSIDVKALAASGPNLFAGISNGIFLTEDFGAHWTSVSTGLSNPSIVSLLVYQTKLYAGTNGAGLWERPLDEMITYVPIQLASFTAVSLGNNRVRLHWRTISEINNYGFYVQRKEESEQEFTELPNSFIPGHGTTLEPHVYEFVDALSPSGQLYYRLRQVDLDGTSHLTGSVSVNSTTAVNENAPLRFALEQNYPNPFNPSTEIRYQIPEVSHVTLKVYDLLGREVATIVDEEKNPGSYEVQFDGSLLSSGILFYRLSAGGVVHTRKALLLK